MRENMPRRLTHALARGHGELSSSMGGAVRRAIGFLLIALIATWFGTASAEAHIAKFEHIVVIVQENRTTDNLFYALCSSNPCSTQPDRHQYDIQTSNWLDKTSPTGVTQPIAVPLAGPYDMGHEHAAFLDQCNMIVASARCQMNGAASVPCSEPCPVRAAFAYVDNSTGILDPYLTMIAQYGWANYMFETSQGPSFPAHQFIFGATSAPNAADDHAGVFDSEEPQPSGKAGCVSLPGATVQLIDPTNGEDPRHRIFPCFEHLTIADILRRAGYSWKYYAVGGSSIWVAPNAINHICQAHAGVCAGTDFLDHVDRNPVDVLRDIGDCALKSVSWVTPSAANSDHARANTGGGPSWVASIVNAIGSNSRCRDQSDHTYWETTAIVITWDDWGGWYDHAPPKILPGPQGDYQYGFRVPLIFVSAYTRKGYIDNANHDFGSIARFIERNFGMPEGKLTFADARSTTNFDKFYDFNRAPRTFDAIPAPLDARYFLNDKSPQLPPDDD
jgi:phospholipase C